ncbi:heavy metal sensor histidine kinase [Massilia terrae]|uniref:Sensor protein n=1 Tax=Massilia terrae TaxID=1811224 RepID=A0ABT2CSB0_9BURK|nr:heavy metal sensor histidine kinase [Massilia terrae]MCS0656867.1 heavy metal sensor histidine kinase [Massilia terrae]
MSSKFAIELDVRRWSLTARLGAFFGAAIAAIVLGVSAMMYAELVHQLREKEELEIRDNLRIQNEVFKHLSKQQNPTQWQHEWSEQQEENKRFGWQLIAPDGTVKLASDNAGAFAAGFARPDLHDDDRTTDSSGDKTRYLLMSSVRAEATGPGMRLRGALDVSQDEKVLRRYLRKLALVVAAATFVAAALGWLLVWRGLAPVRAISAAIGRINAQRLHARIANEAWPSDLRQLALTFDDMLARLERSFEQLSRFSSDLAHEFRSPINNLVAAASVTLGRARDVAEYQNTLEVMVEEGNRLSRMVSSMLFLARADNAQQTVKRERLAVGEEFARLIEFFEIMAEEQGISLRTEGECTLMADPLLLRRALSNLLANALRYTPRGGAVVLKAAAEGNACVISVSDNGCGIAAEHLPHLFDRFYRADPARSSTDSTGLGLAVVRSIAELHGGTVEVRSAPGQGATFEMRFPMASAAAREQAAA